MNRKNGRLVDAGEVLHMVICGDRAALLTARCQLFVFHTHNQALAFPGRDSFSRVQGGRLVQTGDEVVLDMCFLSSTRLLVLFAGSTGVLAEFCLDEDRFSTWRMAGDCLPACARGIRVHETSARACVFSDSDFVIVERRGGGGNAMVRGLNTIRECWNSLVARRNSPPHAHRDMSACE
jgi:hypothetical protein